MNPIIGCALCHKAQTYTPGRPPSDQEHNFVNRCNGRPLLPRPRMSGSHNYMFEDSWRGIATADHDYCRFPLTDRNGNRINHIPHVQYVKLSMGMEIDVQRLANTILTAHYIKFPCPIVSRLEYAYRVPAAAKRDAKTRPVDTDQPAFYDFDK